MIQHQLRYRLATVGLFVIVFAGSGGLYPTSAGGEKAQFMTAERGELPEGLPKAPSGYSWEFFEIIGAYFLVPDGWHTKEEQSPKSKDVYISKESIDEEGMFKTGFTVFALKYGDKARGDNAAPLSRALLKKYHAMAKESWDIRRVGAPDIMPGYAGFSKQDTPIGEITQYTIITANHVTGTVYAMTFESPSELWEQHFKHGRKIVDFMALNPLL